MPGWTFISEFLDSEKRFLSVKCNWKDSMYNILIDTYNDPYIAYYSDANAPVDREELEKTLFDHLQDAYPDHYI